MNEFMGLIRYLFTGSVLFLVVIMILMALPKSRLRGVFLTISGWVMKLLALLCLVYMISPLDVIPDAIPVAGYADDVVALILGLTSAIGGYSTSRAGRNSVECFVESGNQTIDDY